MRATRVLWWLPAVAWVAMIWMLSSSPFRSEESRSRIAELLGWLFGDIRPETALLVNTAVRKCAHLVEYGILAFLLYLGLRGNRDGKEIFRWNGPTAGKVMGMCILLAAADEVHQAYVPGRGASMVDIAIDSMGALLSLWIFYHLSPSRNTLEGGDRRRPSI